MDVTFTAEMEQGIAQKAREHGVAPTEYLQYLVSRDITPQPLTLDLSVDEFLAELNRIGKDLPVLPDHAYMRESMYEDHE